MLAQKQNTPQGPLYAVLAAALLLCILCSVYMMPFVPDDSYISFRYAENLAKGHGLTFNAGEPPVEGYSNYLWILFCAVLHLVGLELPQVMPAVGTLMALANILVLWVLLRRREFGPYQMVLPLLLLASAGPFVTYAVSGLEAPLYALLLLLMVNQLDLMLGSGRTLDWLLFAVFGFLLGLSRPEGLIGFPVMVSALFWVCRGGTGDERFDRHFYRNLVIAAVGFAALVVIYHVWRINYFGEVVPTPFLSKGGAGKSVFEAWRLNMIIYFRLHGDFYPPLGFYFIALAAVAVLGRWLSNSVPQLRRVETVALITAMAHMAVYFNFRDWMPGMRYHSVIIGPLLLCATHALNPLFADERSWNKRVIRRYAVLGAAVFLVNFSVLAQLHVATARMDEAMKACLIPLGKWLGEVMPAGSVMAISDVGAIPYYSRLKTVDVHPESLTDVYIAKNGYSIEYFYQIRADVLVLPSRSQLVTKFYPDHFATAEDPRFGQLYRHLASIRFDWFEDRSYWVFIPRRFPEIPGAVMDRFPQGIGTITNKKK